jgi:hypothetical protein
MGQVSRPPYMKIYLRFCVHLTSYTKRNKFQTQITCLCRIFRFNQSLILDSLYDPIHSYWKTCRDERGYTYVHMYGVIHEMQHKENYIILKRNIFTFTLSICKRDIKSDANITIQFENYIQPLQIIPRAKHHTAYSVKCFLVI